MPLLGAEITIKGAWECSLVKPKVLRWHLQDARAFVGMFADWVCDAGLQHWSLLHTHTYIPSMVGLGRRVSVMRSLHLGMVPELHQWIACSHAGTLYFPQSTIMWSHKGTVSVCCGTFGGKRPRRLVCTRLADWCALQSRADYMCDFYTM